MGRYDNDLISVFLFSFLRIFFLLLFCFLVVVFLHSLSSLSLSASFPPLVLSSSSPRQCDKTKEGAAHTHHHGHPPSIYSSILSVPLLVTPITGCGGGMAHQCRHSACFFGPGGTRASSSPTFTTIPAPDSYSILINTACDRFRRFLCD